MNPPPTDQIKPLSNLSIAAFAAIAVSVVLILTVLVTPYYKAYDHATGIMIVWMCVILLKTTHGGARLFAGICLGLAAVVG